MEELISVFVMVSGLLVITFGLLLIIDCNLSNKEDKIILGSFILCMIFLITILSANFLFVNKKETIYTDIRVKNVIRHKDLYYFIETKDKTFLFIDNELKLNISNKNSLIIKTKYPKIKILSLPKCTRSDYILSVKQ